MIGGLLYAPLIVTSFFRHEGQASGAVLTGLALLLAEGWMDSFELAAADRCAVIAPAVLNIAMSWAVLSDRRSGTGVTIDAGEKATIRCRC